MRGWLAAIFVIRESSRRSVSTLANIIRRPLIIAAGLSELAKLIDM